MDLPETCAEVLSRCPDPPPLKAVASAEQALVRIQALERTSPHPLTPLGMHLSALPCDPRVGRLLIYGALLGCTSTASCIGAAMTARSPFLTGSSPEMRASVDTAKVSLVENFFPLSRNCFWSIITQNVKK